MYHLQRYPKDKPKGDKLATISKNFQLCLQLLQVQMIVSTIGQDWSLGNAALVTATKHSVEIIKSVYIQW